MSPQTIILKIKERVNKLSSDDFDNLPCWTILEAFNKFQYEWCRTQTRGVNMLREGDEQSISKIDDLSQLLVPVNLTWTDKGIYFQTSEALWPENYLRYKRLQVDVKNGCCEESKRLTVYLAEEANVDVLLDDVARRPNYAWGESFVTITGKKLNLYHAHQFSVVSSSMIYYRQPVRVQMTGCADVYNNAVPDQDVHCEFAPDIAEILCSGAAMVLDGDIENYNGAMRLRKDVDNNN